MLVPELVIGFIITGQQHQIVLTMDVGIAGLDQRIGEMLGILGLGPGPITVPEFPVP